MSTLNHEQYTVDCSPVGVGNGLLLQWRHQGSDSTSNILLSRHAGCATLVPASMSKSLQSTLFANEKYREECSNSSEILVYAITDIGELFLLRLAEDNGQFVTLGQTEQDVAWIGTLQVDSEDVICVVHCSGDVMLLNPACAASGDGGGPVPTLWNVFSLNTYVVCCCAVGDTLVTSPGDCVMLSKVELIKNDQPVIVNKLNGIGTRKCDCFACKIVKLHASSVTLVGVVDLSYTGDKLALKTIDGRKYSYKWKEFVNKSETCSVNEKDNNCDNDLDHDQSTISDIMKSMERYNKLMANVGKNSEELNCYIRQLNIAHTLFHSERTISTSENNCIQTKKSFKLHYEVEPSLEENFMFKLKVKFCFELNNVSFHMKWWRVRLSVPVVTGLRHVTFLMKLNTDENVVFFGLTRNEVENLIWDCETDQYLKCEVIFNDYYNIEPIICVETARERLHALRFLSNQRNVLPCLRHSISFTEALLSFNSDNNIDKKDSVQCEAQKINLSYPSTDNVLLILLEVLQPSSCKEHDTALLKAFPLSKQLWYCDNCITVKANITGDTVKLTLSSTSTPLIVSVRREIDRAVHATNKDQNNKPGISSAGQPDTDVIISAKNIQDINVTKRLLGAAHDHTETPGIAAAIYGHVSELINALPL